MVEENNVSYEIDEVVLTSEDFSTYLVKNRTTKRLKIWRGVGAAYVCIFVITLVSLIFFSKLYGKTAINHGSYNLMSYDSLRSTAGLLLMIFFLFIFPWFVYPVLMKKIAQRVYKNSKTMNIPKKYVFDLFGFKIIAPDFEQKYEWNQIMKVNETKSSLVLSISEYTTFIIPKRYLENKREILSLLKYNLNAKYIKEKGGLNI